MPRGPRRPAPDPAGKEEQLMIRPAVLGTENVIGSVMRTTGVRAMPCVDARLQIVALREQRGITRCERGIDRTETRPKLIGIDARPGYCITLDELGKPRCYLQTAARDVMSLIGHGVLPDDADSELWRPSRNRR